MKFIIYASCAYCVDGSIARPFENAIETTNAEKKKVQKITVMLVLLLYSKRISAKHFHYGFMVTANVL